MNTKNLLSGQVAIVTGAGRGIGKATAKALSAAGASVVLAARTEGEILGVAQEIKQAGGHALAIPTDVSDLAQVDHLLVLTLRAFSQVNILVNNAALIQPLGKVWELSPMAWQRLLAVNLVAPFLCARSVLPHMLERGSGRIINISSGAAEVNLQGASAYTSSKAALERFSGTVAAEVEGSGVVVSAFRPGIVDTPMQTEMRQTPAHRFPKVALWKEWHRKNQLRPIDEPAQAIVWLASKFAERSNGRLFSIDDEAFRGQIAADLGVNTLQSRNRA